jgi:carbon-monoxide dehydrogenase large subunit
MMDAVADELGIDPVQVRRVNFIEPHQFPYKTPTGPLYDSGEYDRAISKLVEVSNYPALLAAQAQRRAKYAAGTSDTLLGLGFACYVEMCGFAVQKRYRAGRAQRHRDCFYWYLAPW